MQEEEQHIKAGLEQLEQIVEMNLANMAKAWPTSEKREEVEKIGEIRLDDAQE